MYDDVREGALKTRSRFDGWMGASESRYCLRSDRLSAYEQWSLPYDQALRNELEALHGGFAREPFADDSREYVFVARR